ncbi:hypothetical protein [Leptolyngbya sp. NIES-2104]|uniref:hypothetical protein n=1 Tax=Leptolyngbya sp. NIES-2104 TaxID=1552121 RepID=UPI0006ECC905|nr:hypothetical protein [Leptolyngbya sp. NIES-2104]GAP98537.1 phage protein [Leptolyngbya sp. NIES-2104]
MMPTEDPWEENSFQANMFADNAENGSTNADDEEIVEEELLEDEEPLEDEDLLEGASKERKRSRTSRTYPAGSFADSLELGAAIYEHAGNRVRRLTLLEKIGRSPTSGTTRQMITTSGKYGITKGSYNAEYLELSSEGQIIFDNSKSPRNVLQAKFTLAIDQIPPLKKLYGEYVGKRLPAQEVMRDFLKESGEQIDDFKECIDFFIVNVKDLGLLRTIGGAETLIPIEQALEELPGQYIERNSQPVITQKMDSASESENAEMPHSSVWDSICFYITPIGDEDSEQRRHSDLFLSSLVEPAVSELNLRVIRADKIGQQGLITTQIIEHVRRSRLVIIDLSFLNPNVFYEMALRHACKLPVVHIIRKADQVPFDVSQSRCIIIDNTDIYSFVPKIQTYQAEIATQARKALEDPEHRGNPITVFYPEFWK